MNPIWLSFLIFMTALLSPEAGRAQTQPDATVFSPANPPGMKPIYARAIRLVRQSNPKRTIFVEPGAWGSIAELKNLELPPDDNVIVSVHCYDPFYFTHQGATWAGPDPRQTGIVFPGPPATPPGAGPGAEFETMGAALAHQL